MRDRSLPGAGHERYRLRENSGMDDTGHAKWQMQPSKDASSLTQSTTNLKKFPPLTNIQHKSLLNNNIVTGLRYK